MSELTQAKHLCGTSMAPDCRLEKIALEQEIKRSRPAVLVVNTRTRTIKAHRHRVMVKMQVHSLAELVSVAERTGVLDSATGQTP